MYYLLSVTVDRYENMQRRENPHCVTCKKRKEPVMVIGLINKTDMILCKYELIVLGEPLNLNI